MYIQSVTALRHAAALCGLGAVKINRDELIEGFMDMQEALRLTQANVAAIRVQSEMTETLLDIYA